MKHDGKLDIATGLSAKTKIWKNEKITWGELVQKLSEEHKTRETYKEYSSSTKEEKFKIKDVGGYVGGYLRSGRRNPKNVIHRQIATLDIDFAHTHFWDDFQLQYDNAAVLHSSHSHHHLSPRYRLVFPLSRECTPDEYVAVTRKIAGSLDINLFDNTTFETNRLMFWPSTPKDIDYYFRFQDGPWIDVDEILSEYVDWTDSSSWPTSEKHFNEIKVSAEKQEDPENKKGIIGAFCRTYTITEAIEKYLSDVYVDSGDGRYTYSKGSTAKGLIIYDDKFAFSHHGTDPCSGRLCNAFDLVRIHHFGHHDEDSKLTGNRTKSYKMMEDLAREDSKVRKIIAAENIQNASADFEGFEDVQEDDISWMEDLEIDSRGKYTATSNNLNLIFSNDSRLKSQFRKNKFDSRDYVFGNLPWRKVERPEPIKNVDFSGIRNYIECIYGINSKLKVEDSLMLEMEKNSFHPIIKYLSGLRWDGEKRVDTLLIDYFGVEDNIYTRESMRKVLVGAVSRIMEPGCKFDYVLTITGAQGTGKSTFIKKLGKEWYSDTFLTVQGKDALEQIQGSWIIEMAELAGLRKAEVESIKHFISKQEDVFRPAYGKTVETFKRQCIFIGTTNNEEFLNDPTGNRRFLPVKVNIDKATKCPFEDLDDYQIDQIWAEAYKLYRSGETTYLSEKARLIAEGEQKKYSDLDERTGIIRNYLDMDLPKSWDSLDLLQRREYVEQGETPEKSNVRDFVCVAEIWCECLGKDKDDMDRYKTRRINEIMRNFQDWEYEKSTKRFPIYGVQKYYRRVKKQ